MNILITGISGFVGSYLAEYLLEKENTALIGTVYSSTSIENINHLKDQVTLYEGDLTDREFVRKVIQKVKPDNIYHLAAIAFVGESLKNPEPVIMNNIQAQLNILEEARLQKIDTRVIIIGSADEYGIVTPEDNPMSEELPLKPESPYALSKMTQDLMGYVYTRSFGLSVIRVRPFNHIGPRQSPDFVVSNFAKQIAEAEAGLSEPIVRVGNLSAKRDFTDVRDMVNAYWLAIKKGETGEVYNIGSGNAYEISWVLNTLISFANVPITIENDPKRFRPVDLPITSCNAEKFTRQTGWKPTIAIEDTLLETLNYWRDKIKIHKV